MLNDKNKSNFVTNCCTLAICVLSLTIAIITTATNAHALSTPQSHRDRAELSANVGVGRNVNALQQDSNVLNISPRLEYNNEWRPVGRGDPLKKDPTYDYSPPALERVRYWRADNESKDDVGNTANSKKYSKDFATNSNKKDILVLGMLSENRNRGQSLHADAANQQHKNTAIRRSYYAHHHPHPHHHQQQQQQQQHQLPTDLMPPPMQTIAPPPPQTQTSNLHHMMPSATSQYRQSTPHLTSSSMSTMAMMHSKPPASAMTPAAMMQLYRHQYTNTPPPPPHMAYERDHYHQESMHYYKDSRPSMPNAAYTPSNMIDTRPNSYKTGLSNASRKPWLHELLQKEVVKMPPKIMLNTYEQASPLIGISTTHTPVAFRPMTSTMNTPSTSTTNAPLSMTSTTTFRPTISHMTTSPVFFTTSAPNVATSTLPYMSSTPAKRLLIPTTSNLVERPTITPMKMTTDALFKHYHQPDSPLLGPMYLIIEGHSKVKTYGKDELDPHRPKIVPIIPKREPIVRIADPNEKRGTKETFEVKHLHTVQTTTTPMPKTKATKPTKPTNKTTVPPKPVQNSTSSTATPATITSPTLASLNTNGTTDEPSTTVATSGGMASLFNFLDSSFGSLFGEETNKVGDLNTASNYVTTVSPVNITRLHSVTSDSKPLQLEARIGTHSGSIDSLLDFENDDEDTKDEKVTTEPVPRDVRQVFDYDQLPESRLKDRMDVDVNDDDDENVSAIDGILNEDDSDEDIDMEDLENMENLSSNDYDDDRVDNNDDDNNNDDENHEASERIDKLLEEISDDSNESVEFEEA